MTLGPSLFVVVFAWSQKRLGMPTVIHAVFRTFARKVPASECPEEALGVISLLTTMESSRPTRNKLPIGHCAACNAVSSSLISAW